MQIRLNTGHSVVEKFKIYFLDPWVKWDFLSIFLLILSIILHIVLNERRFEIVKNFYAISFIFSSLRLLKISYIFKEIGPLFILIIEMIKDVIYIIFFMAVFLLAYGVASHSLIFPNSELNFDLIKNILRLPFWHIFGNFFMETNYFVNEQDMFCNKTSTNLKEKCPEESKLVVIYFIIYILIINILMINLLIAMFSNSYENIKNLSESLFCLQRLTIFTEFFDRMILPPPFTLINFLWRLIRFKSVTNWKNNIYLSSLNCDVKNWNDLETQIINKLCS